MRQVRRSRPLRHGACQSFKEELHERAPDLSSLHRTGWFGIPPHTHPYAEFGTVISGSFGVGMGEKLEKKGELSKPGSFWMHPARHAHYGWTGNEEVIMQIQFIGPGGIDYVNPADDPRKK